ncbi:hypothetical protein [Nocardia sp. BMG111209]|uniref:hypothetical protein n=1 Tax=Nocardia sp. BMG111209 TaxID=1160137 RepID=UPI00036D84AA|nr:hypothetical protein [Nocardia sp. BMG111209]
MRDQVIPDLFPDDRIRPYDRITGDDAVYFSVGEIARRFGIGLPVFITEQAWHAAISWEQPAFADGVHAGHVPLVLELRIEATIALLDAVLEAAHERALTGYPPSVIRFGFHTDPSPDENTESCRLGVYLTRDSDDMPTLVIDTDAETGE